MAADRAELARLIDDPEEFLLAEDPILRRMAVTALDEAAARRSITTLDQLAGATEPEVRAATAEALGRCGPDALETLAALSADPEFTVREAVATAYGEIADPASISWLVETAQEDADRGVREAAVASLGAIGDDRAVDPLLSLMADAPPPVRRRAIAAITVFDDPRIEPAIRRAALDRNPGVREAAEMVVGRQVRTPEGQ